LHLPTTLMHKGNARTKYMIKGCGVQGTCHQPIVIRPVHPPRLTSWASVRSEWCNTAASPDIQTAQVQSVGRADECRSGRYSGPTDGRGAPCNCYPWQRDYSPSKICVSSAATPPQLCTRLPKILALSPKAEVIQLMTRT